MPTFCHSLRHTYASDMCEAGVNAKVVQKLLRHADIGITMNVYIDATEALIQREMEKFEDYLNPSGADKPKESNDWIVPVVYGSLQRDRKPWLIELSCNTGEKSV